MERAERGGEISQRSRPISNRDAVRVWRKTAAAATRMMSLVGRWKYQAVAARAKAARERA